MVQIDKATGVSIAVHGSQDTSTAKLQGLLVRQIIAVLGVEHAVRESLARADAEEVAGEACAVTVDVVEGRALLGGDAGAHGAHAEAVALVRVDQVRQDLAGGGHADAALVPQLVKPALHAQVRQPVLAVGCAARHRAQQAVVDLDHLLDRLRRDPVAGCRTRVGAHDDAALEAEGECGGTVSDLDRAVGVLVVICHGPEP